LDWEVSFQKKKKEVQTEGLNTLANVRLCDMIQCMVSVYKSIDLRTACIAEEDHWRNILTVIRFTHETILETKKKQADLATNFGKIDTENFKVVYETLHIKEWTGLKNRFLDGEIAVGGLKVALDGKKDLDALNGNLNRYSNYAVYKDVWNVLEAYSTTSRDTQQVLRVVESDARKAGFPDVYQAINTLLGTKYGSGTTTDVLVLCPALARFSIKKLDPNRRLLSIATEIHKNLRNCILNVIIQENGRQMAQMRQIRFKRQIRLNPHQGVELSRNFKKIKSSIEKLPPIQVNDELDIRLVAGDIEAFSISGQIQEYYTVGLEKVQPLFDVFLEFKHDREFEDLLLHAEKLKVKSKGRIIEAQEVFERSVCWLLNFIGFTCVKMDEREILSELETKVIIGSVDILAYYEAERILVLVNCSLKPPKLEDITTLRDLRKRFSEGVLKGRVNRVVAIFFSLEGGLLEIKQSANKEQVRIYDAYDIKQILSQFREGSLNLKSYFY